MFIFTNFRKVLIFATCVFVFLGTLSGLLIGKRISKVEAASCSITIETAEIVGNTIKFGWKSSDIPIGSEITLNIGSTSETGILPRFGEKISSNPYVYPELPKQKTYFQFVSSGKNVDCKSNMVYFTPPNTLTGAGSGGGPAIENKCDSTKSPPTLAGKVTKSDSQVTVELGWEPTSTSTITQNRSRVYDNGKQVSDQRNQQYYYWKDTFDAKEKHTYTATMMFPTDSSGRNWCETEPSTPVIYDPKTGEMNGSVSDDKSKEIFDKVTPPASGSSCSARCNVGVARYFSISTAIKEAVCDMQCTIIDWMANIISVVIENVLFKALGI